jgi:hypothetical protein
MGLESSSFEKSPEAKKENFEETQEVNFENLNEGDRMIIYTAFKPEGGRGSVHIIDIDKTRRTKDGEIKHLDITFKEVKRYPKKLIKEKEKFLTEISKDDEEVKYLKALNLPDKVGEHEYGWVCETPDELVGQMPGGSRSIKKEYKLDYQDKKFDRIPKQELSIVGNTKGVIRSGENNHFHLNNINYKYRFEETKSGKRRERAYEGSASDPIRKILLFGKEEKE